MAKHKKLKKKGKYRNNGSPGRSSRSMPAARPRRRIRRGERPDMWTAVSAVAGGLGGAALGGWAAREGWDPRWVGAGLATIGGIGAYKLGGNLRVAAHGLAAAGAGQALLEWLDKDEQKSGKPEDKPKGKDAPRELTAAASAEAAPNTRPSNARDGASSLDRAFNRVRERLHRIYEDEDDAAFVHDDAA